MPIGPTQRIPSGLLGLLDVRNDGRYPNALADDVQASLRIEEFLGGNAQEWVTGVVNAAAVGGIAPLSGGLTFGPVSGEFWWVRQAMIFATPNAAEMIRMRPMLGRVAGAGFNQSWVGDSAASSLTDAAAAGAPASTYPRGFLMVPGDLFLIHVERIITAGNITCQAMAHILRFR